MRWLILGQTYFLSKLEYDSTTHVDKRTTFWCLTFDMKNPKNLKKLWSNHKCYIPLESSQWVKKHELHRKWHLKNVQSRKTNFNFTNLERSTQKHDGTVYAQEQNNTRKSRTNSNRYQLNLIIYTKSLNNSPEYHRCSLVLQNYLHMLSW